MTRIHLAALMVLATACGPTGSPREPVDPNLRVIYHNGDVLTMEVEQPIAEAIAIRGEMIEAVGSNEQILALQDDQTTLIDLAGSTLMPGFVDAHSHIFHDHRQMGLSLDEAQSLALKNGITTLGDLFVQKGFLREMQSFEAARLLRVRTSLYLIATDNCGRPKGDWYLEYPPTHNPGEMLRIGGVKIVADGGTCGDPALSFELMPGAGNGDLFFTQSELNDLVAQVQDAGYQAAIHAIGDRAIVQALNAIERVLEGQPNIYRHRMEHNSVIPPEQRSRYGELGVIPVLHGQSFTCNPFGPPVPPAYREWEQAWRSLWETNPGLQIAWHSDTPYASENPMVHLLGFVSRFGLDDGELCPPPEWQRDNLLPVEQTLRVMTIQSAYALFREDEVGSLAPNKLADLIVLSSNPLTVESHLLRNIEVLLAVVGGTVEYCQPTHSYLCPDNMARTPTP